MNGTSSNAKPIIGKAMVVKKKAKKEARGEAQTWWAMLGEGPEYWTCRADGTPCLHPYDGTPDLGNYRKHLPFPAHNERIVRVELVKV